MWQSSTVNVWREIPGAPNAPVSEPSVLTIGVFDGVHRGHQAVLAHVSNYAAVHGLVSVAITFDPHPMSLIAPERAPLALTTIERRVELLHSYGVDHVRVLNFTAEMSGWSPAEFLDQVVVSQCAGRHVIVGENFRFGMKAAGDFAFLQTYGEQAGYSAEVQALSGDAHVFSSTRVREALAAGDVVAASTVLGRLFAIDGEVVHGDHRGRELGFPTANVRVAEHSASPADGVYAGWLSTDQGERFPAAISVGTNPTFDGVDHRRVETYVLDRDDLDLYGATVRIEFAQHIREMKSFDSIGDLLAVMDEDIAKTRRLLSLL